jgi:hypothetical protein
MGKAVRPVLKTAQRIAISQQLAVQKEHQIVGAAVEQDMVGQEALRVACGP